MESSMEASLVASRPPTKRPKTEPHVAAAIRRSRRAQASTYRLWLVPIVILASIALLGFATFYLIDVFATGGGHAHGPDGVVDRYTSFEPGMITDALPSLAAMMAAVLGIVITVVSIVVQLSSERYTGSSTGTSQSAVQHAPE